ncbi:MAG: hypothetical protein ABI551_00410 [Polyangiaceae bacterium]
MRIGMFGSGAAMIFGTWLAAVSGCSTGDPASPTMSGADAGNTGASTTVTFHKDVEPILQTHCQGCHVAGGIAPFTLTSYEDAKDSASEIVSATSKKIMPPWGAVSEPDCTPTHGFQQNPSLTDAQIATLAAWHDAGEPEGDPKDAPPPVGAPVTDLPGVQQKLAPAVPYTLTASGDQFRCFILDPQITTTKYMNGTFVVPGNAQIVHHALLFADTKDEAKNNVPAGGTPGQYDCFGGPGISSPTLVAAWAPGGVPAEYPSNIGMPIAPGTKFVMQVHYHPHTTVTNKTDTTTFQIRYTDAVPEYDVLNLLLGNAESASDGLLPGPDDPASGPAFIIPANAKGHTEEIQYTMPQDIASIPGGLFLYSIAAHEHYVGVKQRITIQHAAPTADMPASECLLNVPQWDFNWQRFYAYQGDGTLEHLPQIAAGDTLDIKCTYDNTMDNPLLAESLHERQMNAPVDVKLGETTLDEMCLGGFSLVHKHIP